MRNLFHARSVVVVGASQRPENLAANIVRNLKKYGFAGRIAAVGRSRGDIEGVPIDPWFDALAEPCDLATVLMPARLVPAVVADCGRNGIPWVHVGSAGFDEFSEEGRTLADQLLQAVRQTGVRLVGPNGLGVMCPASGLVTAFGTMEPVKVGSLAIVSQSGGVGVSMLQLLSAGGVGVSAWASIGNALDLDETDFLQYFAQDPETRAMLFYLEGFKRPDAFFEAAAATGKPVVLLCHNLSSAAEPVARSHTAALMTDADALAAACRRHGVLLTRDLRQAIAAVKALAMPPLRGNRLAVLTRSGGHAVIAADRCQAAGLQCPPLPDDICQIASRNLRAGVVRPANPMDLGDLCDPDAYQQLVTAVTASDSNDGVMLLHTGSTATGAGPSAPLLARSFEQATATGKPVACVSMYWPEMREPLRRQTPLPLFDTVEEAVDGLSWSRRWVLANAAATRYRHEPRFRLDSDVLATAASACPVAGPVLADTAALVLAAAGVRVVPEESVNTPEEAVLAAERLGFPVVLKGLAAAAMHKSEVGGVVLGLNNSAAVRAVARDLLERFQKTFGSEHPVRLLVQPQVTGSLEMFVGSRRIRGMAPVVMVGLGGRWVEVYQQCITALTPLSRTEALDLFESASFAPMLHGGRGQPPRDVAALLDVVLRLAALAEALPRIQEIEINPLLVRPDGRGCLALDARIVLAPEDESPFPACAPLSEP